MDSYPKPFLGPIFPSSVKPVVISTGYEYHAQELALHGVDWHGAIDLTVPRGTEVLSPFDGYAVATYFERQLLTDETNNVPRTISPRQVLERNPFNRDIVPPVGSDESTEHPMFFGLYIVQIYDPVTRFYVQLGHLDYATGMPYHPPIQANGDLVASPILRAPVEEYRDPSKASWIQAGQIVGFVGMAGCGWGSRCYDLARFEADGRPDFRDINYPRAFEPHLHLVVCGPRDPITRDAEWIDPFGIYGNKDAGYPSSREDWHMPQSVARHSPLWLP